MRKTGSALLAGALFLLTPSLSSAADATMHGRDLRRENGGIRFTNFDVTLDGRLLTAESALYHPDTGIVELTGNVKLNFGPKAKEFPGEVK
jgi:hypothetical protein